MCHPRLGVFSVTLIFCLGAARLSFATGLAADSSLPRYDPQPVARPKIAGYLTPSGAITIVGYNDMAEMINALCARFAAAHPDFSFVPVLKGTRTGPPALAAGTSALAPMGAEFSPTELATYRAATGGEPLVIRLAHASLDPRALSGPLAILVHRDNPLRSLTLAEVAAIFSGADRSRGLRPCGLAAETALGIFFRERVLKDGVLATDFVGLTQSAEVVRRVGADVRAIGYAAAMRATPEVRVLALAARAGEPPVAPTVEALASGRYPLDRFLLLAARRPLEPWVREFLRLALSRDGQQAVAGGSLGYLPLAAGEAAAERAKLE